MVLADSLRDSSRKVYYCVQTRSGRRFARNGPGIVRKTGRRLKIRSGGGNSVLARAICGIGRGQGRSAETRDMSQPDSGVEVCQSQALDGSCFSGTMYTHG